MSQSSSAQVSRFSTIATAPPDAILGLTEAFNADKRGDKMNLGVGVYKDASGNTPVLASVKAAERKLVENETTKGYLPIEGHADYRKHIHRLVFGDTAPASRVAIVQSPGGTGGLRVAASFIGDQMRGARAWVPTPTWANHTSIFQSESVAVESYRYLNASKTGLDFDAMMDDIGNKASRGDVILLHACCHNPTGIDPTPEQWKTIAEVVSSRGLMPMIDFAYQGFGKGIEEDRIGINAILEKCDEAIVCNSFSKNFGLYSERVGAVSMLTADDASAVAVQSQLKRLVRSNYSNPPRHGAAVVATILDDPALTNLWESELAEMRNRIASLRSSFVRTMASTGSGHDFSFLNHQFGMFSFSGLNPMQVDQMRSEHAIYMVAGGRINVAGMTEARMQHLCEAVAKVIES
jgi:aspartate/tyrosine/aromatic aminotransferase